MVVSIAAAAVGLAACASIFGVTGGDLLDGSADGAIEGGFDVIPDYVVFDAIDLDVNTAICDGGIPISDAAVWVSGSGGSDNSTCGDDQAHACQTIGQAIKNLKSRSFIYVDNNIFNENVVIQQAGLTLQGGWMSDAGWTPTCNSGATTVQGPDDGGSAAVQIQGVPNVTLRLLTIRSKTNGAAGTGESVYAVRAISAGNVTIDNATLLAQHGGAGAWGSPQITVNSGCSTPGGSGQAGAFGSPGDGGSFSGSDFVPAVGDLGSTGATGQTGSGTPGACKPNCSAECP